MKIITNDSVYVQKKDLIELFKNDISIPQTCSFYNKKEYLSSISYLDNEGFIKFNGDEEINFLKKQDWIINFNDLKSLSKKELVQLRQEVINEKNNLISKFNTLSENRKSIMHNQIFMYCDLLEYKMYSIRDFLNYKHELSNANLPKFMVISDETIKNPTTVKTKQKNDIFQLIKTKFINKKIT